MFWLNNAEIDDVEQLITDVMNGSEFDPEQVADVGYLQKILEKVSEWFEKIWNKITEFLEKLFGDFHGGLFGGGALSGAELAARWVAIVLAVLALAAVIFMIIRTVRKKARRGKNDIGEELKDFTSDPDRAFRLSKDYMEQGDNFLALRYLFIALLARLNKAGAIHADPAKTNRRYQKEIENSRIIPPEETAPFFKLFNSCRYGGREVPEAELRALSGKYEEIDAGLTAYEVQKAEAEKAAGKQTGGGK